jgi:hypothetical protein
MSHRDGIPPLLNHMIILITRTATRLGNVKILLWEIYLVITELFLLRISRKPEGRVEGKLNMGEVNTMYTVWYF